MNSIYKNFSAIVFFSNFETGSFCSRFISSEVRHILIKNFTVDKLILHGKMNVEMEMYPKEEIYDE